MSNLSELLPTGGGQNAVEFTAAENISAGQAVALKTDGQIEAADSANLANVIGLAAAAITSGATGDINVFGGINEAQSSLTIRTNYYINSSGSLTTSSGFPNIELGQAISATTINLRDLSDNHNPLVQGQQAYTSGGTFTWVAPTGVTSVSVVAVGNSGSPANGYIAPNNTGAGGAGGALAYKNNITVVPGTSYTVNVNSSGSSYFGSGICEAGNGGNATITVGGTGGVVIHGDGGGSGGNGGSWGNSNYYFGAGGGAGGYSGAGGAGAQGATPSTARNGGNGSGGGAGGGATQTSGSAGGGGGVGILGEGTSGAGGTPSNADRDGKGGSGGTDGSGSGQGGIYGGGYRGGQVSTRTGAVRIIWSNGVARAFPSTNTGDL